MIKIGVSTASFFGKALTEDTFAMIKDCGADCAEVFLTTFFEYTESFGELLKKKQAETGLEVYSVHSLNTTFEPQLFGIAPRTRTDAVATFEDVLKRGRDLGAKVYTFHGQTRLKKTSYINPENFGKRIEELCAGAREYGINLCLENVHWASFNKPEFLQDIRPFAPSLGAVLDIKQAWQSERDWREYVDVMGKSLKNIHACDHDKDYKTCMVGEGVFDFESFVNTLVQKGYDGPIMIEQYAKDYDDFDQIRRSVAFLKNIVEECYAH